MFKFINKIFSKEKSIKVHTVEIPNMPIGFALEAETNRKLKNYELALEFINKAINIDPDNDMYWVTKALTYRDIKNYDGALIAINKAIELNSNVEMTIMLKKEILTAKNN